MDKTAQHEAVYGKLGPRVVKALEARHFQAWYFDKAPAAVDHLFTLIPRDHVVSWGGSETMRLQGVIDRVKAEGFQVIDRDTAKTPEERVELMRRSLLCDTYLTGTNALSEDGQLVNIDGNGNRVAAMTYGPRQVIVLAGMNKVAKTLADAQVRAQTIAAPLNAQRFPALKNPCNLNGSCAGCISADTICTYITTTRISKPAGRIKVILVGEALGF